jgi:hypothetical protein
MPLKLYCGLVGRVAHRGTAGGSASRGPNSRERARYPRKTSGRPTGHFTNSASRLRALASQRTIAISDPVRRLSSPEEQLTGHRIGAGMKDKQSHFSRHRNFAQNRWTRRESIVRKTVIDTRSEPRAKPEPEWLDLEKVAKIEVTSEDPGYPLESALVSGTGPGWRAAERGRQLIRILFDSPTRLRQIRLEFSETEIARTQEFTLRWATAAGAPFKEIVRQQWSFSPQGSTLETEDYQLDLEGVSILELDLKPDLTPANARASLAKWRVM